MMDRRTAAKALGLAERALKAASDRPALLDTMAQVRLAMGEHGQAIELLRQALAKVPEDPGLRLHLAQALVAGGERAAAREELERALASKSHFPDRADAQQLLGSLRQPQRRIPAPAPTWRAGRSGAAGCLFAPVQHNRRRARFPTLSAPTGDP